MHPDHHPRVKAPDHGKDKPTSGIGLACSTTAPALGAAVLSSNQQTVSTPWVRAADMNGIARAARSGDASARSLAGYVWVPVEATRNCAAGRPELVLQRLVRPGVEEQWLQVWTMYQRDDLTKDDQVIASTM